MDIRYIAGFFDGEGSINIVLHKDHDGVYRFVFSVSIFQNRPAVLRQIQKRFGGSLHPQGRGFEWRATSKNGTAFLKAIVPYLIVKREEARIALRFRSLVRIGEYEMISGQVTNRIPIHIHGEMKRLWAKLMSLQGRGNRLGKKSKELLRSINE